MPEPLPRRSRQVHLPGSSSASSAFPWNRMVGFPASSREHDFPRTSFRGCSYSVMFRPPSLLASQIVPTAASFPAGQLRRLHPSRTCVVAFARIGYASRPTTGNWRHKDFHLARFTALSTAPYSLLVRLFHPLPHAGLSRRTVTAMFQQFVHSSRQIRYRKNLADDGGNCSRPHVP